MRAAARRRLGVRPRGRHDLSSGSSRPAKCCAWTPAASSAFQPTRGLRHSIRRRDQDRAVRRRRVVLRHAARAGQNLAAIAAVQPAGRPHRRRRRRKPAAAGARKARCSAASGECWTGTIREVTMLLRCGGVESKSKRRWAPQSMTLARVRRRTNFRAVLECGVIRRFLRFVIARRRPPSTRRACST